MRSATTIAMRPLDALKLNPRNARTHSKKQITQIAKTIEAFGFVNPVLVDETSMLIAGHGRLAAARMLGYETVPVIELTDLTETQKRQLLLADNKIAANAGWDREMLAIELGELVVLDDGLDVTGFEPPEVEQILSDHEDDASDPADDMPEPAAGPAVSHHGDLWLLGSHRLLCGDARQAAAVARLCGADRAAMAFLDPPYNVRVADIVGRGQRKHAEFAMGSGEMSDEAYRAFLTTTLGHAARYSWDGAVHYVCSDWRHVADLMRVGDDVFDATLNLAVWVKSNAGQGAFYRSQHELVGVFRVGDTPHRNNVELGRHGRNRSNVWHYAGVNSFRKDGLDELAAHPTAKPVAMVADAIKDCTKRGDHVLDVFGGAGATLLACERVGRRALVLEYEPRFVDVTVRRWQAFTGKDAIHADTGRPFDEIVADTAAEVSS